jgi:hypothetical protein
MTLLQKIQNLTWWNEINKLKDILTGINTAINNLLTSGIQSVTGDSVDNTYTQNPIVNAIPLAGTVVDKPVTGNILLENVIKIKSKADFGAEGAFFFDEDAPTISVISGSDEGKVTVGLDRVLYGSSDPSAVGFSGLYDYSANITSLDYPQVVYVHSLLPQVADNFANDAAASVGGIAVGRMYHTAGAVKVRLS